MTNINTVTVPEKCLDCVYVPTHGFLHTNLRHSGNSKINLFGTFGIKMINFKNNFVLFSKFIVQTTEENISTSYLRRSLSLKLNCSLRKTGKQKCRLMKFERFHILPVPSRRGWNRTRKSQPRTHHFPKPEN